MSSMPEGSLEQYVPEKDFVRLLGPPSEEFYRLTNALLTAPEEAWTKRVYFLLHSQADELESFLDDYGARYNQTYCLLRELVASARGFALAGLSLEHLSRRIEGYGVFAQLGPAETPRARGDLVRARALVRGSLQRILRAARQEAMFHGVDVPSDASTEIEAEDAFVRFRLPRNVGTEEIEDEEQRIAEVSSKYLQACTMLEEARISRLESPEERERLLATSCTEELARVYEATVHNLQSTYDTHIKNTVLEAKDGRLPRLRGHVSATLHLLEAVTQLTHFMERHESDVRDDDARFRLSELVPRNDVSEIAVNVLLYWANRYMQLARPVAEDLLPTYTNVQTLEVVLEDGVYLHARPASLIVSIVHRYGTPVEMEVEKQVCNAGSILELMVAVGSHPDARRFVFRGDEHPLRDIGLLFQHGLGERGIESLPLDLSYLRGS